MTVKKENGHRQNLEEEVQVLSKIGTQTSGRQTQPEMSHPADPRRHNSGGQTTIGQDGMPAAYKSPHMSRPRHRRSCRDPIMPPPSPDQVSPRGTQRAVQGHHTQHRPPIRTAPGKKPSMPIRRCTTEDQPGTGRCTASVAQDPAKGGRGGKYARGRSSSFVSFFPAGIAIPPPFFQQPTSHSNFPSPSQQTISPNTSTPSCTIKAQKHLARERDDHKKKGPAPVPPRLMQLSGSIRQVRGRLGWAISTRLSYWPGSLASRPRSTCGRAVNSSVF